MVNYAEDLNLNAADFRSCMTTQAHMNDITASLNEAVALGLNSTPSILVNDKLMTEAFDYGALSSEIDRLLEAAGVSARHIAAVADIVAALADEARPGDLVVIMSNGGFGDIHRKLLAALAGKG